MAEAESKKKTSLSLFTKLTHSAFFSSSSLRKERELETSTKVADEFIIDSLEKFRVAHGLKNFILAGHSLGIPKLPPTEMHADPSDIDWRFIVFDGLWQMNVTPQSMVRIMGRRGADVVSNSINARFNRRK